jgi:hypothetical protein
MNISSFKIRRHAEHRNSSTPRPVMLTTATFGHNLKYRFTIVPGMPHDVGTVGIILDARPDAHRLYSAPLTLTRLRR